MAGEDHPQRPEAVEESVTQTAMEVDEPTTVPVKTKPTPRVILDGGVDSHFHLDRLARRVRGEKCMCKSMALYSVLQEASPKSPPLLQLQMAVASFCDRPERDAGGKRQKQNITGRPTKGSQTAAILWVTPQVCVTPHLQGNRGGGETKNVALASKYGGLW